MDDNRLSIQFGRQKKEYQLQLISISIILFDWGKFKPSFHFRNEMEINILFEGIGGLELFEMEKLKCKQF